MFLLTFSVIFLLSNHQTVSTISIQLSSQTSVKNKEVQKHIQKEKTNAICFYHCLASSNYNCNNRKKTYRCQIFTVDSRTSPRLYKDRIYNIHKKNIFCTFNHNIKQLHNIKYHFDQKVRNFLRSAKRHYNKLDFNTCRNTQKIPNYAKGLPNFGINCISYLHNAEICKFCFNNLYLTLSFVTTSHEKCSFVQHCISCHHPLHPVRIAKFHYSSFFDKKDKNEKKKLIFKKVENCLKSKTEPKDRFYLWQPSVQCNTSARRNVYNSYNKRTIFYLLVRAFRGSFEEVKNDIKSERILDNLREIAVCFNYKKVKITLLNKKKLSVSQTFDSSFSFEKYSNGMKKTDKNAKKIFCKMVENNGILLTLNNPATSEMTPLMQKNNSKIKFDYFHDRNMGRFDEKKIKISFIKTDKNNGIKDGLERFLKKFYEKNEPRQKDVEVNETFRKNENKDTEKTRVGTGKYWSKIQKMPYKQIEKKNESAERLHLKQIIFVEINWTIYFLINDLYDNGGGLKDEGYLYWENGIGNMSTLICGNSADGSICYECICYEYISDTVHLSWSNRGLEDRNRNITHECGIKAKLSDLGDYQRNGAEKFNYDTDAVNSPLSIIIYDFEKVHLCNNTNVSYTRKDNIKNNKNFKKTTNKIHNEKNVKRENYNCNFAKSLKANPNEIELPENLKNFFKKTSANNNNYEKNEIKGTIDRCIFGKVYEDQNATNRRQKRNSGNLNETKTEKRSKNKFKAYLNTNFEYVENNIESNLFIQNGNDTNYKFQKKRMNEFINSKNDFLPIFINNKSFSNEKSEKNHILKSKIFSKKRLKKTIFTKEVLLKNASINQAYNNNKKKVYFDKESGKKKNYESRGQDSLEDIGPSWMQGIEVGEIILKDSNIT